MYIQLIIDHSQWKQTILFFGATGCQESFCDSSMYCQSFTDVYDFDEYVKLIIAKFEYIFCCMTISDELKCE